MAQITNCVAIDCEMVSAVTGEKLAARVSIVNKYGQVILDKYIKPSKPIGDYCTIFSGITPAHLKNAENLSQVRSKVAKIINGRIVIGHTLNVDLKVLGLTEIETKRRDVAQFPPFKSMNGGYPVSLKTLTRELLGRTIQEGPHSSVEDAKAAMDIYLWIIRNCL